MILGVLVVAVVFGVLSNVALLALFHLMLDTQASQVVRPAAGPLRLIPHAAEDWAPPSSKTSPSA